MDKTKLILGLLLAVSCQKVVLPPEEVPALITCVVEDDATKGVGVLTTEGMRTEGFGLYASWNQAETHFDPVSAPGRVYLENQPVTYGGSAWETGAYWPVGVWLDFFAYAPYQASVDSGDMLHFPAYGGGLPRATITPAASASSQVDFCAAIPVFDRAQSDGSVPFNFRHILTRVLFYVNVNGDAASSYKVTGLSLSGVAASNSFTFSSLTGEAVVWDNHSGTDGNYSLSTGELSDSKIKKVSELTTETGLDRYTCAVTDAGTLFLVPQTLVDAAKVTVTVTRYDSSDTIVDSAEFVRNLPAGQVWHAGETLSYTLTLDMS